MAALKQKHKNKRNRSQLLFWNVLSLLINLNFNHSLIYLFILYYYN
jgi:hypothetical protein